MNRTFHQTARCDLYKMLLITKERVNRTFHQTARCDLYKMLLTLLAKFGMLDVQIFFGESAG